MEIENNAQSINTIVSEFSINILAFKNDKNRIHKELI